MPSKSRKSCAYLFSVTCLLTSWLSACGATVDPLEQQRLGQVQQLIAQLQQTPGVLNARISGKYTEGHTHIPVSTTDCLISVDAAQSQVQNVQNRINQLQSSSPYKICILSTDVSK